MALHCRLSFLKVIIHTPIVPTLRRGNEDRDALASRTAGAVLRRSHAGCGNDNCRGD